MKIIQNLVDTDGEQEKVGLESISEVRMLITKLLPGSVSTIRFLLCRIWLEDFVTPSLLLDRSPFEVQSHHERDYNNGSRAIHEKNVCQR